MGSGKTKPTGKTGHVRASRALGTPEFVTVPFPTTKDDVERYVAAPFVLVAAHHGFFPFEVLGPPEKNHENDLDFTLQTSDGPKYLELREIHPRELGLDAVDRSRASSYEIEGTAYRVLEGIRKKSRRYQGATTRGIILLTYITHWQVTLVEEVFHLLSYWMLEEPPIFEQVYYASFLGPGDVSISLLYPLPVEIFSRFDPGIYRGLRYINLSPEDWFQINE
jgi:hypothetical protein